MAGKGRGEGDPGALPSDAIYLLDRISTGDIKRDKARAKQLLEFHWKYYTDLAFQRYQARDPIRNSLLKAAKERFIFKGWQRVVGWKWTLSPLSTAGSKSDPGGRFNFGNIDRPRFPVFPALYIAENKTTGLQEMLGQEPSHVMNQLGVRLTAFDLALAREDSISVLSIAGRLESYIDLGDMGRLQPLIDIFREFTVSAEVRRMAAVMKLPPPKVLTKLDQLKHELLKPDWRAYPTQVDAPSNSQIFGQLVKEAELDGIVYPSKFGSARCLALYPEALEKSDSLAELEHDPPTPDVIRRLDRTTWKHLT